MKLDPAPDPFDFHDDRSRDVTSESGEGGQNVPPSDPDEIRRLGEGDPVSDPSSDPGSVFPDPDVPGRQIPGQGHVYQERHEENIGIHRGPVAFSRKSG